jgi:hypothetical protein
LFSIVSYTRGTTLDRIDLMLAYLVFDVFFLVKMGQGDVCRVLIAFLQVLTGHRNINAGHVPPIGKSLAIVEPWKGALPNGVNTINIPVSSNGNMKLQRVAFNGKLIPQIVIGTGIAMKGKKVPIGTVLFSGVANYCSVS